MHHTTVESSMPAFASIDSDATSLVGGQSSGPTDKDKFLRPESLNNFLIFCTSDFTIVSKEVHVRTRRVRLVGLEV